MTNVEVPNVEGMTKHECPVFFARYVLAAAMLANIAAGDEVRVSHCWQGDSVRAINDGVEPKSPRDRPRHSFWPHKGTNEWVEYHFDQPRKLAATEIYWLDDTPGGGCPVPASWRLFYRQGDRWLPVDNTSPFGVEKGVFNRVTFKPVETPALRIEVKSRPGFGSGIIEWDVRDDPQRVLIRRIRRQLGQLYSFHFQPHPSELILRIWDTQGLSPDAQQYFARLRQFKRRFDKLLSELEVGIVEDKVVRKFAEEVRCFLAEQPKQLGPIAFFTRYPLTRPNAVNCYIWQSVPERWGCSIRTNDPARPDRPAQAIFEDPAGCIFDMNLSRDASTLFFSFRKQSEPCWQIWEIGVDGQDLNRISRDPQYHEVGAIELPDGDLLFVSTRRGGYTLCQPGPCSNLHVMRRDGSDVRCVSQNTLADFSPRLLPDGRVLFTRWEYIDRDLTYRQSLWTQNPDGRHFQLFFGNTIRDVGTFWQARPVPGKGNLLVATFAPHHGWPHGAIGLIDNRAGLEAPRGQGFVWMTHEFRQIGDRSYRWSYRDPFPVNDYQFLVAYGGGGDGAGRFALHLLDLCGNNVPLYSDPEQGCYGPLLLRPERAALQVSSMENGSAAPDDSVPWGTVMVADVYQGLSEIERGRVKYVQIMEQVRKTADLTSRAYDQSPVMSYATYYAKRCWGRVPVEPDGSAHFQVPALREIYLQVLDAEGRELQRQTSAIQLMPGEMQSCIGCHEPRNAAPPYENAMASIAAGGPPDRPEPPAWAPDGIIDFVRVVQPVLDKYCVECHSGGNPDGGYDLSGDKTRLFNMAYDNLLGRSRSYRQHDMATGEMLPTEAAKGKPMVHFYWLLRTPTAVNRPLETGSHASRLMDYIDTDHCGKMIPLEDRQRVYTWIDANVPYYGTYDHSRPRSPGYRDLFTDPETGLESEWYAKRFLPVYAKRCQSCHDSIPHPNDHGRIWDGCYAWINLSRPEHSAALTAHLDQCAGGRGCGAEEDGRGEPLFKDTSDPDYVALLAAIRDGRRSMLAHPRADMPGFKE